ncbi:hypothetical protein ACK1YT_004723 [Salmonella enterica]
MGRILDIMCTDIAYLPDTLKVAGSMMLSNTRITTLPDNLHQWVAACIWMLWV